MGLDSHADDGGGEFDGLQHDRVVLAAEGISGDRVTQPNHRSDLAGVEAIHHFLAVRMHAEDSPHTLPLALGRVPRQARHC